MTALAKKKDTELARPLSVLAPLIKKDLEEMESAKECAAEPYHERIAAKMVEARSQCSYAEFISWSHRHFKLKESATKDYLRLGKDRANYGAAATYSSMEDYKSRGLGYNREKVSKRDWHEPVAKTVDLAKREAERLREESLNRAQEREAERKLALRLIDIGYRVLAKELHPDAGRKDAGMQRLNRVRDRLKNHA